MLLLYPSVYFNSETVETLMVMDYPAMKDNNLSLQK